MSEFKPMNPTIKRKWLKALRGKSERTYKQTQSWLRRYRGGYCCLGVLCDIVDPKGWRLVEHPDEGDEKVWYHTFSDGFMPSPVVRAAAGFSPGNDPCGRLSVMNDNQHASFAEIADYIEENL